MGRSTLFIAILAIFSVTLLVCIVEERLSSAYDREMIRGFQFHDRTLHGSKILFSTHSLDTTVTPNFQGSVQRYSLGSFRRQMMFYWSRYVSPLTFKGTSSFQDSGMWKTYLVQFAGDVTLNQQLKDEFSRSVNDQVRLGAYVPHNSFLITCQDESVLEQAHRFPGVTWIGSFPTTAKLHTTVTDRLESPTVSTGGDEITAHPHQGCSSPAHTLDIRLSPNSGFSAEHLALQWRSELTELLSGTASTDCVSSLEVFTLPNVRNNRIIVHLTPDLESTVNHVTAHPGVISVSVRPRMHTRNEFVQWLDQSFSPSKQSVGVEYPGRTVWQHGLTGQGQIIHVSDTGLDWDHCFFRPSPGDPRPSATVDHSARKVIAYQPISDTTDDVNGHGTHVCGTALGYAPTYPDVNTHAGQATGAQIYFSDMETQGTSYLDGFDNVDFTQQVMLPAYEAGARIYSASWGSDGNSYDSTCSDLDEFLWNHTDSLFVVAAGNAGGHRSSSSFNIGSPAVAKSVFAIAAGHTSNLGQVSAVEFQNWTAKVEAAQASYGSDVNCCDPSNSYLNGYCCESYNVGQIIANSATYNEGNLAYFSSRGPTADGRFKPDIVGVGSTVVSSRSDGTPNSTWDQCETNYTALFPLDGTSMATPGVAGSAALVRQYLTEGWYPSGLRSPVDAMLAPSGALIEALMLNGARSLTGNVDIFNDGSYLYSLVNTTYPLGYLQGYGHIILDNCLWFADETRYLLWLQDSVPIATGQDKDWAFSILADGVVRITMRYYDHPGLVTAALPTVNDIDLYAGTNLTGNGALAGNFVTMRDALNTNEGITIQVNSGDTLYVKLRGINVPMGSLSNGNSQDVAIVVTGPIDTIPTTPVGFTVPDFPVFVPPSPPGDSSVNVGLIVGAVVGGVVIALVIVFAIWAYCHWCRKPNIKDEISMRDR